MIKNEEEIVRDWREIHDEHAKQICDILHDHELKVQDYLAHMVAAQCDVTTQDMMTKDDRLHFSHARWLFWYAYRYMTNDTYEHIAQISERFGRKFTQQGISASVNKMSSLIAAETVWTKRWILVKKVIKARDRALEIDFSAACRLPDDKISLNIPKNLRDKLEINYN